MQSLKFRVAVGSATIMAFSMAYLAFHKKNDSSPDPIQVSSMMIETPRDKIPGVVSDAKENLKRQLVLGAQKVDLQAVFSATSREYAPAVEKYFSHTYPAIQNEEEDKELASLVEGLKSALSRQGLRSREQTQIIHQLGRHFYNESMIGRRQNMPRPERIKYLKLAIAHLKKEV